MSGRDLACVVISCGNEPGLVRAVRSVLAQDVPVELVVVNSAGGSAADTLSAAGLDVPLWECEERLNPGAVRNRGIAMTSAPYVSFLAADCVAESGWARERLELHRAGADAVASALVNATPDSPAAEAAFLLLFYTRLPEAPKGRRVPFGGSYARSLFEAHGTFREDLRTGEDSEFNERIAPVELVWSSDVRTAHGHPETVAGMVSEQAQRGRRMARTLAQLRGPGAERIVANRALTHGRAALGVAWGTPRLASPMRRRVAALIPVAAGAYATGALVAALEAWAGNRARRVFGVAAIPSAAPPDGRRPVRLLAVLAVRDELERLPGLLAALGPQVDGIVALDDGSSDGSADWLERRSEVLEVIRVPADRERWLEMENHRRLVEAAIRHDAEWIVAVDADERLERDFRARAERVIARGRWLGLRAYAMRVREMWGDDATYRADGVWGEKTSARLFEAREDMRLDERELHGHKAPLDAALPGTSRFARADIELLHLGMLTPEARLARRRRYEELDPGAQWQPAIGYRYMTDESGIELRHHDPDRGWGVWVRHDGLRLATAGGHALARRAAGTLRSAKRRGEGARARLRARAIDARNLIATAGVPSAGVSSARRVRLLAVLAVRDELEELPGCLASLVPEVDGIVALDDGSSDGSADWLEARPEVLEVIRVPPHEEGFLEMENHRRLVEAAVRHGADWIVSVDADERLEPGFRARAERVIVRGRWLGFDAFALRVRELWGSPDTYRADGIWGRKAVARLFRARPDHRFDEGLHGRKGPMQVYERFGYFPIADLELHHRGVLTEDLRAERRARYERLDPDARWQPDLGYAYLTDERGLVLRPVSRRRGWLAWGAELRDAARRRRG